MKTVLLAFDGVDDGHFDRFSSVLPTIDSLRKGGTSAELEATVPPTPGSMWPSVVTGTGPGSHGVFDETVLEGYPGTERPVSAVDVRRPTLWDYLTGEGSNTLVCGLPVTRPPGPINGAVIPGNRPCGGVSADDHDVLVETVPDRLAHTAATAKGPWTASPTASPATLARVIDCRRRVARTLLETEPWELAIVHVPVAYPSLLEGEGDTADPLRDAYRAADRLVADVLECVPPDTNIVGCSPSGIRRTSGYRVHLNEFLVERGFLEYDRDSSSETTQGVVRSAIETLAKYLRVARRSSEAAEAGAERFAWNRSRAFCPSDTGSGLWLNVAGREPAGTIVNSAYESTRSTIIEALSKLETPDGDPAFEFVCEREHLYDGSFVRDAPDIVVSTSGTNCTISAAPSDRVFTPFEGFEHTGVGTFFATGPNVVGNVDLPRLTLPDVAPIVMGLLGRPVPSLMTGSVPDGVLRDPVVRGTYPSVATGAATSDPTFDDELLGERLKEFDYR